MRRFGPALEERDFRLWWLALLGMGISLQMLEVAIGWQVYGQRRSALDLGWIGLAEFVPMFVLALPAGVVFSLLGFEQAVQLGGEAANPSRDLPRAVILSILIGGAIYILLQVAFIGADDEVAAPKGGFDHAGVDDVGSAGPAGEGPGGPGLGVIQGLDFASGEEPGEERLARCASPALGDDGGRD